MSEIDTKLRPSALLAVMAGGAVGAAARYRLWQVWPDGTGFPRTTFIINVAGCLLLGMFAGLVPDQGEGVTAVFRSFVKFGVLAGFTTVSFYAVQGVTLTHPRLGAAYLVVTPAAAILATWLGVSAATRLRTARDSG